MSRCKLKAVFVMTGLGIIYIMHLYFILHFVLSCLILTKKSYESFIVTYLECDLFKM